MLQFIAMQRLPLVALTSIVVAGIFWRNGWRSSLMAAAIGTMISSAVVMIAIMLNLTDLWWLPADKQVPLHIDVPSFLHPVVAPVEILAADQLHLQAAIIAMKFFAYYTLAVVGAMIIVIILMIWKYIDFRRDVQFVRRALENNPHLLDK